MTPDPVVALGRMRFGHICDACNRSVRTGDICRVYATVYDHEWVARRLWCTDCGSTTIAEGTPGADEVIVEAVFWQHRLVSIEICDRSCPDN